MKTKTQLWPYMPNNPDQKAREEYHRAFQVAQDKWPEIEFTYTGHDGTDHYFQEWGNPEPFKVVIEA